MQGDDPSLEAGGYYSGTDGTPAGGGATSGAEIQDPATGQWYPYVPGDAHDNGRGGIRINGTVYSYDAGQQALAAQQSAGGGLGGQIAAGDTVGAVGNGGAGNGLGEQIRYPEQGAGVTTDPGTGTGGTGGGGGGGTGAPGGGVTDPGLYAPFTGQQPAFVSPPAYVPPPAFSYADFQAPTLEQAINQPGYQFGLQQGEQALQQSAAAQGLLRTGGTLKDILNYGQNAATQNYANVFNQNLSAYNTNRAGAVQQYNTNYQTQFQDPYSVAATQAQNTNAYNTDAYKTAADIFYANENNPFAKYSTLLDIGSKAT